MKKISKITLENFRAFLGKKEINFNNSSNEPADFVCIYGKNGSGKTSLFDGFEWFFTGEIYLLEKDLKSNVSRYMGDILRNRYASNDESAGINIEYSDGTQGHRTIKKRIDSINDYNKGMPSGVCRNMINKKQILPHSKIDSFVYANKPTQMYDEWGNYWDPDNSQRDFFKSIYDVYRNINNGNKECSGTLQEVQAELIGLNIERKIDNYNEAVLKFNSLKIREIAELKPLQFDYNKKIDVGTILAGEKLVEPLQNIITANGYLSNQCDYLEKHIEEYERFIQYREEVLSRRKRWERILIKCNQKKALLEQKETLLIKKAKFVENRDKIGNEFDEQWFLCYQRFLEEKIKYTSVEEKIQSDNLSKQKLQNSIDLLNDNNKLYAVNLKNLSDSYAGWRTQIEALESKENSILCDIPLNRLSETKEEVDAKKDKKEKELEYLLRALKGAYEKFVDSLSEEESLKYSWIKQLFAKIEKSKNRLTYHIEQEKEAKDQYEKIKEETDNLDNLLTLAKKEIQKKNTHVCPICNSPFASMEELLNKIDLSAQQKILYLSKAQWDAYKEAVKKSTEDYESECRYVKESIEKMIYEIQQSIVELERISEKCRKEIKEKTDYLQELNHDKEKLKLKISETIGIEICELTNSCVSQAYENKVNDINAKLNKSTEKINIQQKEIEKLNNILESDMILLEELKESKNNFYNDSNNRKKLEILEQRKLFSYKDYLEAISEYNDGINKMESDISQIQDTLESYKIYQTDNTEKYLLLLNKLKIPTNKRIDKYEQYRNNVFNKKCISHKTILKYKNIFEQNVDWAQKKIEILNNCLSDLSIKECIKKYNELEEEREKLQLECKLSECKLKVAEEIFSSAQTQLEEHIKNVFGGITISHIYEKIEPHKRFRHLQYQIVFNDDGKPELYIKALNGKEDGVIPELFFSSAQLNAVALSVFLGGALSATNPSTNTIFIDDPIGHFDDLNVLSFIDVIRTIISETNWQIIISTHEENFYELMKVKLSSKYYNSKFFIFKDEGTVVEDSLI